MGLQEPRLTSCTETVPLRSQISHASLVLDTVDEDVQPYRKRPLTRVASEAQSSWSRALDMTHLMRHLDASCKHLGQLAWQW